MEDVLAIGIDLGTTNCSVAVFQDGRVEILETESGTRTIPSYVAFSQNGRLIGELAKNLMMDELENTVYDVKRWIGTRFDDQRIQDQFGRWTFNLRKNGDMSRIVATFCEEQKEFESEEISAMILEHLKQMAENHLGKKRVTKAVISVPANFNDSQRQATIDAGKIAGFDVLAIINEPTAAALCYGMKKKSSPIKKTVLIFDLGGGTFDVSVVNIEDDKFTVRSTAGDCHLGGNDFDNALVDYCLDNFKDQHGLDPSTDKCAMQRLRIVCERAKIRLSTSNQTTIKVDYLFKQQHFSLAMDRTQFEYLCREYFDRIMSLVSDVVREANAEQIDDIVLVGGSTRIPIIKQLLQKHFGLKEIRHNSVNPDLAVVNGAAIYAAILNRQKDCPNFALTDVCSHSFGCESGNGEIIGIVQRNTPIPHQFKFTHSVWNSLRNKENKKKQGFIGNLLGITNAPESNNSDVNTTAIYKIYEVDLILDLQRDGSTVSGVKQSGGSCNEVTDTKQIIDRYQEIDHSKLNEGFSANHRNQGIYEDLFINIGQFNCWKNQSLTIVIDINGILNVMTDSLNLKNVLCKQFCLSDAEIMTKRKMLQQFQQTDQQYREIYPQKNKLETVLLAIRERGYGQLKQRLTTTNTTKMEIAKYQQDLVKLYKLMANPRMSFSNQYAIGIDLGTTYSCVAIFRNERIEVIENLDSGQRTTPSYVAFTGQERLVGEAAKNHRTEDPANTVYDVKRLIGRRFDDETVRGDVKRWPFKVVKAEQGMSKIEVTYNGEVKRYSPEEISAMVLAKMRQVAEDYMEQEVTKAVITVPAYFNDAQRQATIDAGKIAGLEVLQIINEPTAAGYCYGLNRKGIGKRNVLIYDLGGGTFDVTVMNIEGDHFTVKSTGGNCHLGGEDFDILLANHCVEKFKERHSRDLSTDKRAFQIIRSKCEAAKIALSSSSQTTIRLDHLFESVQYPLMITRAVFEQLCDQLFRSTLDTVTSVLADAKLNKSQIDDVVLVGGSTRIPKIQLLLQGYFNRTELRQSVNPDLAVAHGAAIKAAILTSQDDCEAIQRMKIHDVTPLSLGVEVVVKRMCMVVEHNTQIPTTKEKILETSHDYQTCVSFPIFEGESARSTDNHFLGEFEIDGIPSAPQGEEKFTCTFKIDENGILNVSAVNQSTGKSNKITITNNGQLPEEKVQRSIKEAERFRKQDQERRLKNEAKNELQDLVYKLKPILEQEINKGTSHWNEIGDELKIAQRLLDGSETCSARSIDEQRAKLEKLHAQIEEDERFRKQYQERRLKNEAKNELLDLVYKLKSILEQGTYKSTSHWDEIEEQIDVAQRLLDQSETCSARSIDEQRAKLEKLHAQIEEDERFRKQYQERRLKNEAKNELQDLVYKLKLILKQGTYKGTSHWDEIEEQLDVGQRLLDQSETCSARSIDEQRAKLEKLHAQIEEDERFRKQYQERRLKNEAKNELQDLVYKLKSILKQGTYKGTSHWDEIEEQLDVGQRLLDQSETCSARSIDEQRAKLEKLHAQIEEDERFRKQYQGRRLKNKAKNELQDLVYKLKSILKQGTYKSTSHWDEIEEQLDVAQRLLDQSETCSARSIDEQRAKLEKLHAEFPQTPNSKCTIVVEAPN